ncbi:MULTISPECIES: acylneuraminate cytidylyltransferase family protein [unclassified Providencia]|uniref:acylneuraminate cytidylyltransferase family protein n=1 Tax=unclassified Providencia TaxID=2633465 RepID=UPI0012B62024|nr:MULTISPECIES: acylneuraminate cytidylyltransferase family protein [unclassified Providencia]MTC22284.1 acylneuraminate cytidylyltransferase family protein [Providencia sp. wls1938]
MNIAIIPARAGSKRLPKKNIKLLNGKPLITWTIEAAIKSNIFDRIIVSTDSIEIKEISEASGAEVPFIRSPELSTDIATTNDVITNVIEHLESIGHSIKTITLLQPTSPLRTAKNIQDAFLLKNKKEAKAIVSVCEIEFPYNLCNKLPADHSLNNFILQENNKRTQDQEIYYRLNGAIYIFDRTFVSKLAELYTKGTYAYIMPREESIDIDNMLDFKLAEILATESNSNKNE